MQGKQTKRPKPVFTDGRKLDNSRDWEKVKIAKPPPEDLSTPSTKTSSSSSTTSFVLSKTKLPNEVMRSDGSIRLHSLDQLANIRKELDGLQRDIEQSQQIQGTYETFLQNRMSLHLEGPPTFRTK